GFFTVPMDKHWVALLSADRSEWMLSVARNFSRWGDLWGTGIVAALLFAAGAALRSSRMKRAALAVLLAASLAGLSANVVRFSVGRPRPVSKKPDGLYGPTTQYRLLGFPSAHASTASATASTVAVVFPLIGLPLVALAVGVMWSRIHRRRHHPTDVLVGAFIGALFGIGLGLSAKRESEGTS
ncbi:MAG: phosphatase PAP2 family protein, partial [Myxococcota bacterium]